HVDPGSVPQELVAAHADERAPKMATEEGTWLGRWRTGQPEQEDGAAAEGSKQKGGSRWIHQRQDEAKAHRRTYCTPEEARNGSHRDSKFPAVRRFVAHLWGLLNVQVARLSINAYPSCRE